MKLQGTITALVTPFKNHVLDEEGLISNIDIQMAGGINGILLLGSTGESTTLTTEEQIRIITIAVQRAKGKVPIWVGTGSNCTRLTIEKTKRAQQLGADIALIVTPYYNKPSQEGIFRHFEAISSNSDIPVIIYNIQGRCGVNIETSTLMRIAELPNIIGVKEASGNIIQVGEVIHQMIDKFPEFSVFSGDDVLTLPMMSMGAVGIVSVVSNLIPQPIITLVKAALSNEFDLARKMHYQLLPLYKAAFIETNPVPIKTAMNLCGMPSGDCRLPLSRMEIKNYEHLHQVLLQMQLIKN